MTDKVTIVLSCGTDNPNRSARALHLAKVAKERGKEVAVFLLDEAVYIAKQGIADHLKAATGDVADDLLAYLQEFGVPIIACTPCARSRQIGEVDLIRGARMGSAAELIELACDSAVISL